MPTFRARRSCLDKQKIFTFIFITTTLNLGLLAAVSSKAKYKQGKGESWIIAYLIHDWAYHLSS